MEKEHHIADNEQTGADFSDDYASILDNVSLRYHRVGHYYQVGEPEITQGWIIHLSVIKIEVLILLQRIVPLLAEKNIPFKIPLNRQVAENLLSGILGHNQLGKIVCIYPPTDEQAAAIAKELIALTFDLKGPAIPTDRRLSNIIYTRYGGFNPVVLTGPSGEIEQFINDGHGNLIKDTEHIPFRMPENRNWPFSALTGCLPPKAGRVLNKYYIPVTTLKVDFKGYVKKGLNVKKWWNVHWCVIKEGKTGMCSDELGRDMVDRIKWQVKVHKHLAGTGLVPDIYDYFEIDGNALMVMEFIEGISLRQLLDDTYRGRAWVSLTKEEQGMLAGYLLQVISMLQKLHGAGYIHRDLTPHNFLLDKNGRMVFIDLELAYPIRENRPLAPFQLGTQGFMSPEQMATAIPETAEDIYGLGALMIEFFCGISPANIQVPAKIAEDILFFTGSTPLVNLLKACLEPDPAKRPQLTYIRNVIESLSFRMKSQPVGTHLREVRLKMILTMARHLVNWSLQALGTDKFIRPDGLWFSHVVREKSQVSNNTVELTSYSGLHEGISGVLYLIAEAQINGYDVSYLSGHYQRNVDYIKRKMQQVPPGLFSGTAGIVVAIARGMEAGLIEDSANHRQLITESLLLPNDDLNVATGIAGQGIALLQCADFLDEGIEEKALAAIVQTLLDKQQRDGSWILTKKDVQEKGIKLYGLSYGIAGIVYFLIQYAEKYNDHRVIIAIRKSLDWLMEQSNESEDHYIWPLSPSNKIIIPWLEDGYTGIALLFIKGYAFFRDERYKKVAESALQQHPAYIMSNHVSLANGLAGIGETYLEAYWAFDDPEWKQRADWIAGRFLHTCFQQEDDLLFWQQSQLTPTADLMVGNGGIIHFLMRYHTGKSGFPVFN